MNKYAEAAKGIKNRSSLQGGDTFQFMTPEEKLGRPEPSKERKYMLKKTNEMFMDTNLT